MAINSCVFNRKDVLNQGNTRSCPRRETRDRPNVLAKLCIDKPTLWPQHKLSPWAQHGGDSNSMKKKVRKEEKEGGRKEGSKEI